MLWIYHVCSDIDHDRDFKMNSSMNEQLLILKMLFSKGGSIIIFVSVSCAYIPMA